MKHIIKIIYFAFIINSTQILASAPPIDVNIDMNHLQTEIQERLSNADQPFLGNSRKQDLAQFYQSRQYRPVWFDENGRSEAADYLVDAFTNAGGEGLNPNDYKQAVLALLEAEKYPGRATESELILTKTALKYIEDIHGNRLNPQNIPNELYVAKTPIVASKILADNMRSNPSGAWLASYTFNNPHYQALKRALADYRQALDASPFRDPDSARKIQQIVINMERWRWLPEKMPHRYAIINVAGFDLKCIENGRVALAMPVVVGKDTRKTPVFVSTVESIRFNPSWHLPRHIAIEDSLPKIKANPGYIDERKYILYNAAGQAIDHYRVDWNSINENNFNFHIRQIPGSHNALGKIRFGLTNSNNYYLHDTPDKEYFDESVRTFSSGCVRLKKPDEFASFVFNDLENWPLSKIKENMEGTLTKNVPVAEELPVYITYFTASEDETGQVQHHSDVYGRDQHLVKFLTDRPEIDTSRTTYHLPPSHQNRRFLGY